MNKNTHIKIKGPIPNTKSTILAVLGVVFFSSLTSIIVELIFFLDFLRGILKLDFVNNSSKQLSLKLHKDK